MFNRKSSAPILLIILFAFGCGTATKQVATKKNLDETETITILLPYYLNEEFSKIFKSLGFKVLYVKTYQELEKLVETNQIDLAIEWQHDERDFTIRDLIGRYGKQAKIFLALNWNNKKPSDFDELGYCDVLEVPFKIKSMRVKFYDALPPSKKKIFKQLPIWAE